MNQGTPMVRSNPGYDPESARRYFQGRIDLQTDPSDLATDLTSDQPPIVVDARSTGSFRAGHIPGALNLPYRDIGPGSLGDLDKDRRVVVYCTGIGCNAAKKAAVRLIDLGFRVQELEGGITEWAKQGHEVERA